jgi:hypothetical protein
MLFFFLNKIKINNFYLYKIIVIKIDYVISKLYFKIFIKLK